MTPLAHLSYPALVFILAASFLRIDYSSLGLVALMAGALFPDFDLFLFSFFSKERKFSPLDFLVLVFVSVVPNLDRFVNKFLKKERFEKSFGHRSWVTHRPLFYSPLLILFCFRPSLTVGLFCFGIYSHFILDTLVGEGIRWGYPFYKKEVRIGSWKKGRMNAIDYYRQYKKTFLYKLELLAFFFVLIVLVASFF